MGKKIKFEESSGNVFEDLNLPHADELFIKAALGIEVFQIIEARKLTQVEAAKILGVKQPEISRLKNGKFNHYSVERLLTFLTHLNHDIEIHLVPTENKIGEQRVMKEEPINQATSDQPKTDKVNDYDVSESAGKYANKNLIQLDVDVAEMFPNTKSVNEALRTLVNITTNQKKENGM